MPLTPLSNSSSPTAPTTPSARDESSSASKAETMADELLADGSSLKDLEKRGYGLNLDNPDFRQMLVNALTTALQKFKENENISGELTAEQKKTFLDQFVERAENLLIGNSSLSSNLSRWMNAVADWPAWRDSISETDGRNVLNVYQQRLDKLSKLRKDQYDSVKSLADKQKLLNSARAKVLASLKSTDSTTNSTSVGLPSFTKEEKDLMTERGISFPTGATNVGQMNVLSEKLSNEVKTLGDDSQLKTTDLQDTNSKYNSNVEAINKFLQQMYDASKAQLY